jgi:hypothetical protein
VTVPPGTVYWTDCHEAGCPYRGPVRDDPVEALVAFKDDHQATHPEKDFDTLGWPDSLAWVSRGGSLRERSLARQASLTPLDAAPAVDDEEEPDEGEPEAVEEPAAEPVKAPAQLGLAAFGLA